MRPDVRCGRSVVVKKKVKEEKGKDNKLFMLRNFILNFHSLQFPVISDKHLQTLKRQRKLSGVPLPFVIGFIDVFTLKIQDNKLISRFILITEQSTVEDDAASSSHCTDSIFCLFVCFHHQHQQKKKIFSSLNLQNFLPINHKTETFFLFACADKFDDNNGEGSFVEISSSTLEIRVSRNGNIFILVYHF